MGNASSNKFDDSQTPKPATVANDDKKASVKKPAGNEKQKSAGFFGGIFNKLSLKPKNQMILPDDKNPAVS
jgi:hypothetical protein